MAYTAGVNEGVQHWPGRHEVQYMRLVYHDEYSGAQETVESYLAEARKGTEAHPNASSLYVLTFEHRSHVPEIVHHHHHVLRYISRVIDEYGTDSVLVQRDFRPVVPDAIRPSQPFLPLGRRVAKQMPVLDLFDALDLECSCVTLPKDDKIPEKAMITLTIYKTFEFSHEKTEFNEEELEWTAEANEDEDSLAAAAIDPYWALDPKNAEMRSKDNRRHIGARKRAREARANLQDWVGKK